MSFNERFNAYFTRLKPDFNLPPGIEVLYPYSDPEVLTAVQKFGDRYMNGNRKRTFLLGINPGRFGAGVTGISFTDPVKLNNDLNISNDFEKRGELSSELVYEMIDHLGGARNFYRSFYIGSVCPLGFVKNGKNLNYYDDAVLQKTLEPWIAEQIEDQIKMGARRDCAFSIGKGKNLKFLKTLNERNGWFDRIKTIPHPRWVMQYRRKQKAEILEDIKAELLPFMK